MHRLKLGAAVGAVCLLGLGSALVVAQEGRGRGRGPQGPLQPNVTWTDWQPVNGKGGEPVSGPYQVVKNWPVPGGALQDGWVINAEGIWAETPDRIYANGRGTHKWPYNAFWGPGAMRGLGVQIPADMAKNQRMVVVYNGQGKVIEYWEDAAQYLGDVQQIEVNPYDPEHHVWIATDVSLEEFTHDGKHVKSLTVKDIPAAQTQDGKFIVEHYALTPDGSIWASGGYRIVHFDKNGKFVGAWGKKGNGPGELGVTGNEEHGNGVHGVMIDARRNRMYIVDRVNSRIDVFDTSGKFLDMWPNMPGPYCIRLTADGQFAWVSDGYTQRVTKYNALTGHMVPNSSWGTMGIAPGAIWGFHWFTTDSQNNLYVGEDMAFRIQKFTPLAGGNPAQLIGQLMP